MGMYAFISMDLCSLIFEENQRNLGGLPILGNLDKVPSNGLGVIMFSRTINIKG